jgi:hypothetical protein
MVKKQNDSQSKVLSFVLLSFFLLLSLTQTQTKIYITETEVLPCPPLAPLAVSSLFGASGSVPVLWYYGQYYRSETLLEGMSTD